ncbi:hypothetical protein M9335_000283 [Escherichia coli]|nr:hypothetical protein [Escherichia coli]
MIIKTLKMSARKRS